VAILASQDEYQERYCAFVDILGFQGLIDQLRDCPRSFLALKRVLETIHSPPAGHSTSYASEFKAQSISDAVAVSTAINADGLQHMIDALIDLTLRLLREGYFVRGGLVKGRLYHNRKTVFGEALVQAYHLEHDVANYPRIMVRSDVVEDVRKYFAECPSSEILRQEAS
jgi:hypothetical protein